MDNGYEQEPSDEDEQYRQHGDGRKSRIKEKSTAQKKKDALKKLFAALLADDESDESDDDNHADDSNAKGNTSGNPTPPSAPGPYRSTTMSASLAEIPRLGAPFLMANRSLNDGHQSSPTPFTGGMQQPGSSSYPAHAGQAGPSYGGIPPTAYGGYGQAANPTSLFAMGKPLFTSGKGKGKEKKKTKGKVGAAEGDVSSLY
jgi:hypothetical protein